MTPGRKRIDTKLYPIRIILSFLHLGIKKTPCPESASELYRPSDRRFSAKLVVNYEECFLGCGAVWVCFKQIFRRNVSLPSSGLKK
jgi:hypothetical protein